MMISPQKIVCEKCQSTDLDLDYAEETDPEKGVAKIIYNCCECEARMIVTFVAAETELYA